jgi:hypothetical protein
MGMKPLLATLCFASIFFSSCSKKSDDPAAASVPVRIEISPAVQSTAVGTTATFQLRYFNDMGVQAPIPGNVNWSSSNTGIATINGQGQATGIAAGQSTITASLNNLTTSATLNVVAGTNQLASVVVMPSDFAELSLSDTTTLKAEGRTLGGVVIPGLTFSWTSANTALVTVSSSGLATGRAYGTANVTASASGIQSTPVMVQVIRKGNFSGSGSTGTAKLKIENGSLKLQTSADFRVSGGAPDLRIYLTNNSNNVNSALEVASLNQRSGAQSWNLPGSVTITQYRYVLVWCKQFGGSYGVADLGQ